jgi:hypothetical protein
MELLLKALLLSKTRAKWWYMAGEDKIEIQMSNQLVIRKKITPQDKELTFLHLKKRKNSQSQYSNQM